MNKPFYLMDPLNGPLDVIHQAIGPGCGSQRRQILIIKGSIQRQTSLDLGNGLIQLVGKTWHRIAFERSLKEELVQIMQCAPDSQTFPINDHGSLFGDEHMSGGEIPMRQHEPDRSVATTSRRGRQRSEEANPQLAIDIRLIVEPHTHSDPELKTERQYTNLSAAEVRTALLARGYQEDQLPSERTLRDILNRMNYRLRRIQKGKPLKKTEDTDAIFESVHAAREEYRDDPETLEISVDTKTKVSLGEYALGGKNQNGQRGQGHQRLGP